MQEGFGFVVVGDDAGDGGERVLGGHDQGNEGGRVGEGGDPNEGRVGDKIEGTASKTDGFVVLA